MEVTHGEISINLLLPLLSKSKLMTTLHDNYVYIMTNKHKNVLYTGVTSKLGQRVTQHENGHYDGFTKKYNCHFLVYYEHFNDIELAIAREKKNNLISSFNPEWLFLNDDVKFL